MRDDAPADGTVSADELTRLTALFIQFEGAADPTSRECREAESDFNSLIEQLFREKVEPKYQSVTLHQFRRFARNQCRLRASRGSSEFPCV
jgi:hypothetical protein